MSRELPLLTVEIITSWNDREKTLLMLHECPVASTPQQIFNGLRESEFTEMLFVSPNLKSGGWQMNTIGMKSEIDILFFDSAHSLVRCWDEVPLNITLFPTEAYMVLELPGGTCKNYGINTRNNARLSLSVET